MYIFISVLLVFLWRHHSYPSQQSGCGCYWQVSEANSGRSENRLGIRHLEVERYGFWAAEYLILKWKVKQLELEWTFLIMEDRLLMRICLFSSNDSANFISGDEYTQKEKKKKILNVSYFSKLVSWTILHSSPKRAIFTDLLMSFYVGVDPLN